jgi:hypothetical protein
MRAKFRGPTENEIQSTIIDYLKQKRYFFWRQNSGAMQISHRFLRFGKVGSPDIFVVKKGRIIGLEVKRPDGEQSQAQIQFGHDLVAAGGYYYVVRSLDEAIKALGNGTGYVTLDTAFLCRKWWADGEHDTPDTGCPKCKRLAELRAEEGRK